MTIDRSHLKLLKMKDPYGSDGINTLEWSD